MRKNTKILVETWRRFLNESTIDRIFESIQTLYFHNESKENKGKIILVDNGSVIEVEYSGFDGIEGSIRCDDISKENNSYYAGYGPAVLADGRPVWQISSSSSYKTWGPLLYDICIEYISVVRGGAVMSDRNQVSGFAEEVWGKYQNRSDVKKVQMDFGELGSNTDPDADALSILRHNPLPGHLGIEKDESLEEPYSINYSAPASDNYENTYSPITQHSPNNPSDDVNQYSTFANLIKKGKSVEEISDIWIDSPLSKAYYKESLDVINKLKSLNLYIEE